MLGIRSHPPPQAGCPLRDPGPLPVPYLSVNQSNFSSPCESGHHPLVPRFEPVCLTAKVSGFDSEIGNNIETTMSTPIMKTATETPFESFLNQHDEEGWLAAVTTLLRSIHEVDKTAIQIWFSFYPLRLVYRPATGGRSGETRARIATPGKLLSQGPNRFFAQVYLRTPLLARSEEGRRATCGQVEQTSVCVRRSKGSSPWHFASRSNSRGRTRRRWRIKG